MPTVLTAHSPMHTRLPDDESADDADGVEIVGTKGGTLASNLPHPRAHCTVHPITLSKAAKRTVRGNEKHCPWCVATIKA